MGYSRTKKDKEDDDGADKRIDNHKEPITAFERSILRFFGIPRPNPPPLSPLDRQQILIDAMHLSTKLTDEVRKLETNSRAQNQEILRLTKMRSMHEKWDTLTLERIKLKVARVMANNTLILKYETFNDRIESYVIAIQSSDLTSSLVKATSDMTTLAKQLMNKTLSPEEIEDTMNNIMEDQRELEVTTTIINKALQTQDPTFQLSNKELRIYIDELVLEEEEEEKEEEEEDIKEKTVAKQKKQININNKKMKKKKEVEMPIVLEEDDDEPDEAMSSSSDVPLLSTEKKRPQQRRLQSPQLG